MDKNTFILESASRLCSSLHAEKSLVNFFNYIQQVLPVKEFSLAASAEGILSSLVSLANITPERADCTMRITPMSAEHKKLARQIGIHKLDRHMAEMITRDDDVLLQYMRMFSTSRDAKPPLFWLRLVRDKARVGSAIFCTARILTETEQNLLQALEGPLSIALNNIMQYKKLASLKESLLEDNRRLQSELGGTSQTKVIGQETGLKGVMQKVRKAAPVNVPVLITGETGSGKEVIARAIHELSARCAQPFVAVNCGAIPPSLVDSELFGHAKGAFTGAVAAHNGLFERAHGGTLFLDECGDLPLNIQVRLLRVLESMEFERVGGDSPVKVDVRVIAATHRDLPSMVHEGRFREDLLYRLRVVHLTIPPLRERKEDIPELARFLMHLIAIRYGILPPIIPHNELERMMEYDWPGNVRELQNTLEEALACSNDEPLRVFLRKDIAQQEHKTNRPLVDTPVADPADLDAFMRSYLLRCLQACNGKVSGAAGAAKLAGINPSTFRFKCKKLGIDKSGL